MASCQHWFAGDVSVVTVTDGYARWCWAAKIAPLVYPPKTLADG